MSTKRNSASNSASNANSASKGASDGGIFKRPEYMDGPPVSAVEVDVELVGLSQLSQGKVIEAKKPTEQNHDAFEEEVWSQRAHFNADGHMVIPGPAFKGALVEVARFLGEKIKGRGQSTYTKRFAAGLLCMEPAVLVDHNGKPITRETMKSERLFVPADGIAGSGKRVWKRFPLVDAGWRTTVNLQVMEQTLIDAPGKVMEYLQHAGRLIGVGRFRPIKGGFYGRFEPVNATWRVVAYQTTEAA